MTENEFEGDPFSVRMLFLRIGWMNRYQGLTRSDQITGGGAYVKQHGRGAEIFNFRPFRGHVFGYAKPPQGDRINIGRLGAADADISISGVLAIWVATHPLGGSCIAGWYKNATVYRDCQELPPTSHREHYYYVTAAKEDATLLPPDGRLVQVPTPLARRWSRKS